MEFFFLLFQTVVLRPYVFIFLMISLYSGRQLLGWSRTIRFFGITWGTAFLCEYSSTRVGFPFGDYYYTGSTVDRELFLSNIPFMDSLSFSFLLFASYCMALSLVLPSRTSGEPRGWEFDPDFRTSWVVMGLSVMFFTFSDIVIDPVALQGDRWFLGKIYGYKDEGIYFGVPLANFGGWVIVGSLSFFLYRWLERGRFADSPVPNLIVRKEVLIGVGLYYVVLFFNLGITFWIGEVFMGLVGCFIFTPVTVVVLVIIREKLNRSFSSHATLEDMVD